MTKILSQSGQSLADIYDIEGSVAGLENLETRELPIVHEMGATILSERFTTRIFRLATGDILQSASWRIELTTLPETPARLLGVQVITDNATRISRAAVLGTDPTVEQDIPLWVWNATVSETVTMEDLAVAATFNYLVPREGASIPSFVGGREQQDNMVSQVTFVGLSTAFGAGNVLCTALLYLAFPRRDINISSKGLPIPSW